jgi:hypothetical protein
VLGGHVQVSALPVQPDCMVSRNVTNEKVPTGKPDGRVEGATEDAGVGGLSVSEPAGVVGLPWWSAGTAPPVVEGAELLHVVSDSTALLCVVKHTCLLASSSSRLLHPPPAQ